MVTKIFKNAIKQIENMFWKTNLKSKYDNNIVLFTYMQEKKVFLILYIR